VSRRITPMLTLIVLSSLADGHVHAYELKKRIGMGVGKFMRVSDGSLYPLLRDLEAAGLIVGHTEAAEHGRPDRVVYTITDDGRGELATRAAAPLAEDSDSATDFYVRVVCFPFVSTDARQRLIKERRGRVHADLAALAAAGALVAHVSGHAELVDLRTRQLNAELDWLDELERSL